jgi:hypothetical protein
MDELSQNIEMNPSIVSQIDIGLRGWRTALFKLSMIVIFQTVKKALHACAARKHPIARGFHHGFEI